MTGKIKKTYNLSKQSTDKLFQLRNYHNRTYDSLIELMIENAFLSMNEAINLTKGKQLEEQNLKVGFQVQQLTLMFSELKKELAEVKTENQNLKEKLHSNGNKLDETNKRIEVEEKKNKGRSERFTAQIETINNWILNKDKSWLDKIKG